jgi:conjugative relaxase-like TrwC/TraI family protein
MLSISKPLSSAQAHTYHQQEFSNSRDNYYTEDNKVRGEWHGRLAAQWNLKGEVLEQQFARLADGQHPISGAQLVQHRSSYEYTNGAGQTNRTMEHRAGWDATFSAPKSVSLTGLVGRDDRVRVAHQESVNAALNELEKHAQARTGGNHPAETTGKWIAAKFEHDSSRPVDGYAAPQLHTHVVIFNVTERGNGETRALQPHELYRSQQYATAVYRSELALRLNQLGYEIEQSANGAPEIKGYSQEYLDASSPRRQQIKEHLAQQGINGAEAAEIAAHRTRDSKLDVSHEEMQRRHRELADKYGNQPERVVQQAQARVQEIDKLKPTEEQAQQAAAKAVRYAVEKNFEREAVSDERDLMRDTLKRAMGQAPLEKIRKQFHQEIQHGGLIELERQPGQSRREFTTNEMIHLERENVRLMQAGQNQYPALVSFEIRRQLEEHYPHLSNSQRGAVNEILGSHDRITALEGVAGAGKTTSLAAIRAAAERDGYQVEGFAPTSRAVQKLAEAGIESSTLQRHLIRGPQENDGQKHLYVLDESSLAGTRQMNQFFRGLAVEDRVLLVGDVRQHEAVEAGRPYHQMQQAGMRTAHLDEIVRQQDPALKEVVEQLSRREIQPAINGLERQGRVYEIADREERFQAIAHEYGRHPTGTLVVSPDNQSRRELNAFIHHEMQERGQVKTEEHRLRVLEPRNEMTGADRGWAGQYQIDDVVRYSRGSKSLGIHAGDYATVKHADSEVNLLTVERQDGKQVTYDPRRLQGVSVYRESQRDFSEGDRVQFTAPSKELHVANRELGSVVEVKERGKISIHADSGRLVEFNIEDHPHLDYGYAVTSHSSQGQTADRVLIHVDTEEGQQLVNARMAYVAVSRARYDAQVFTNDKEELAEALGREVSHRTATSPQRSHEHKHDHQHTEDAGHKIGPSSVGKDDAHGHDAGAQSQAHSEGAGQGQAAGE